MLESVPTHVQLGVLGILAGLVLGATMRATRFCTACAVRSVVMEKDWGHARMLAVAIAVAIACAQTLHIANIVDLRDSIFWSGPINVFGPIVGGLVFGAGMALVGSCAFTTLIRASGGDMRGLVDAIVIGVTGYATMRGLFAIPRLLATDATTLPLEGILPPDLPGLVNAAFGADLRAPTVAALVVLTLAWAYRDPGFRANTRYQVGAIVVGLTVGFGWLVTGYLGADPFDPMTPSSIGYISGIADTLLYIMAYTGSTINFGIGIVIGTVIGAATAAYVMRTATLQTFGDRAEMARHLLGSALMGIGGITAMGCTIGQGLTGISTLAFGSALAILSIWAGSVFTMRLLVGDTVSAAARRVLPDFRRT